MSLEDYLGGPEPGEQSKSNRNNLLADNKPLLDSTTKRRTTSQLEPSKFCDYIGLVCYVRYDRTLGNDTAVFVMTDYTENDLLPFQDAENRPIGKASIIVTLWDEHAHQAQLMGVEPGQLLFLKNLLCKIDRHGVIQLSMNGYRPGRMHYKIPDPISILNPQNSLVEPLRQRKSRYEMQMASIDRGGRVESTPSVASRNGSVAPTRNESVAPSNESVAPRNKSVAPRNESVALWNKSVAPQPLAGTSNGKVALTPEPGRTSDTTHSISVKRESSVTPQQHRPTSNGSSAPWIPHIANTHVNSLVKKEPAQQTGARDIYSTKAASHSPVSVRAAGPHVEALTVSNESPTEVLLTDIRSEQRNYKGAKPFVSLLSLFRIKGEHFLTPHVKLSAVPQNEQGEIYELHQQIAVTVDDNNAKRLFGKNLNACNMDGKSDQKENILNRLKQIGIPKKENGENGGTSSTVFLDCCIQISKSPESEPEVVLDNESSSQSLGEEEREEQAEQAEQAEQVEQAEPVVKKRRVHEMVDTGSRSHAKMMKRAQTALHSSKVANNGRDNGASLYPWWDIREDFMAKLVHTVIK
ncbi:hypothetical protein BGZ94_003283 [Podila epigama]|nr:hypothetical protein BGZ94_003283 [Podila epigama]